MGASYQGGRYLVGLIASGGAPLCAPERIAPPTHEPAAQYAIAPRKIVPKQIVRTGAMAIAPYGSFSSPRGSNPEVRKELISHGTRLFERISAPIPEVVLGLLDEREFMRG